MRLISMARWQLIGIAGLLALAALAAGWLCLRGLPARRVETRRYAVRCTFHVIEQALWEYNLRSNERVFPEQISELISTDLIESFAKRCKPAVRLAGEFPLNLYSRETMVNQAPDKLTPGNFSYVPLHTTTYFATTAPQIQPSSFILICCSTASDSPARAGYEWLRTNLPGCAIYDGFGDHGSDRPWLEKGIHGSAVKVVEWESLGAALRRAGYKGLAARLEADVPEERGRERFAAFVREEWKKAEQLHDEPTLALLEQTGIGIK